MVHPTLILASGSPRRRELLAAMGVDFEVLVAEVEEVSDVQGSTPTAVATENAQRKASAVAAQRPEAWVLGADTVVALDGQLFGKPASREQAADFLRALSGRTHEVITACALIAPTRRAALFHDVSRVTFHALDDATIARYLDEVNVLDKAGAYALQEHGDWIVDRVQGSRTNVIGLPVELLAEHLAHHGLLPAGAAKA